MRIISLIVGIAAAAWGGVILYRAWFLEPTATVVITEARVHEYPSVLRLAGGVILLLFGAALAFYAARRRPM
ncbi:MAG TPA: hypothetical protein VGB17_14025 [Pyrinomonadaceae bacterium]|jgi:hypothetical protein